MDKKKINQLIVESMLEKMAEYGIKKEAIPAVFDLVMIKDDELRKLSRGEK